MLMGKESPKRSYANRTEHPVSDDLFRLQPEQKQIRGHGYCEGLPCIEREQIWSLGAPEGKDIGEEL